MHDFITTLAWMFGVLSILVIIIRIVGYIGYVDSTAELRDLVNDRRTTFPIWIPSIVAIICIAWLITI